LIGKAFFGVVPALLCCSAHAETDVLLMGNLGSSGRFQ
jgi:hypothetical protein